MSSGIHRARLRPAIFWACIVALLLIRAGALGQSSELRAPEADASVAALPEAPRPTQRPAHPPAESSPAPAMARIKGVVSDIQGGLVPGAHIIIASTAPPTTHEATADSAGFFSVGGLVPGTYSVTISSPGLKTYVVHDLHLRPGQIYSLPEISLPIAQTEADITVTLTTEELAETELHNELHQRVLGVLPNFYTSYQWDAAPLTAKQKFKLTLHAASDPVFLSTTAITAGISLARNDESEYGGGEAGYWSRYGAAYGDAVIGRFMGSVVFSTVFHQDPRYFVMTNGSWQRRAWHAVSSTFMQRDDRTRRFEPAYAHLLGSATTGLIASTYHPGSSSGKMVLDDTILDLGDKAANNLIREFVLRHLAKHIPSYAKGRPPED
ncbi:MAG TPA: carboxypeptidase-like regulatory domain-containing protein [Acidobacteriaceae bacterium]|nr:carboxypeptidase-like regulatory domain-containing protein [Acidobacteriaceae bacterium]